MSCCLSEDERAQKRVDAEISRQLKRDMMERRREIKILLLGTGESGKSTFMKQMRIIHGQGYSESDCLQLKPLIYRNIMTSTETLLSAMEQLKIGYTNPDITRYLQLLRTLNPDTVQDIGEEACEAIQRVWEDEGVQECYQRRNQYQLSGSTKYFLDDLPRICAKDYIPTVHDVLRVHVPTRGVYEYVFTINRVAYRVFEVGEQRSSSRKWSHCFENVTSVMFVVAISEFDQWLGEADQRVNRMVESLRLFETMVSYPWFEKSSIILFLNKKDLFEEKIMHSHLGDYFPEYTGPRCDHMQAREYIAKMFINVNDRRSADIYPHFTCATDTEGIKFVLDAMKNHILQYSLPHADALL